MRTLIYIFFALTISQSCIAQDRLNDGQYTQGGKRFTVTKNVSAYSGRTSFVVREVGRFDHKPFPAAKDPNGIPTGKKDIHFDIDKVKEIVNTILATDKKNLQANKDRIDLSFTFLRESGSIENISYFFDGNTIITLKDIAKIDRELKKTIKASFTGNEYKNFYLIPYGLVEITF
jgi:hypothetical protein